MKVLLFTTLLFSGLVSGLFYAYSCSVNIGLRHLTDSEYIRAMQSINIAIQNPVFFITFMGLLILFPVSVFQLYKQETSSFYWMLAAMAFYFIAVFGVTVFGNVPLNEQLAKFPVSTASETDISKMRQAFETPWNSYHLIRTISSIIAFGLTILSVFKLKS
jgi:uncharacterized membrane protein